MSTGNDVVEDGTPPRVYIVAPTYMEPAAVRGLLHSCRKVSYPDWVLLVVNGNPGDETTRLLAEQVTGGCIREIAGSSNLFWSGAVNLGLRVVLQEARAHDLVLLINCDTSFDDDLVSAMVDVLGGKGASVIGALAQADGLAISSGIKVRSWVLALNWHPFVGEDSKLLMAVPPMSVDFLPGRCVMFPVEALRRGGLVAEGILPHYAADYEFTNRLRRSGFPAYLCPSLQVTCDAGNTGNDLYVRRVGLGRRMADVFSIKSSYNPATRVRYVWSTYPWYAIPSATIVYLLKTMAEVLFGGRIVKRVAGGGGGKPAGTRVGR